MTLLPGMVAQAGVIALMVALTSLSFVSVRQRPSVPLCLMNPPATAVEMPAAGFVDPLTEARRPCDDPPPPWTRGPLRSGELAVATEGPEGSGRYWTVTIGLAPGPGAAPVRGVCLETSTRGFPALQRSGNGGLPWVADRDDDGAAEVVFWTTFFNTPSQSPPDTGLMAWIYRVDPAAGSLTLDWTLSRAMARELSAVYRVPLDGPPSATLPLTNETRQKAARALDAFASRTCTVRGEPTGR
jgi:hypothetical protein